MKKMMLISCALVCSTAICRAQAQPRTKESRSTKDTIKTAAPARPPATPTPQAPAKESRSTRDTTRTALPPRDTTRRDTSRRDTPIIKRTSTPPPAGKQH